MKKKTLENRQSFTRKLMQLLVLMAMLLAPKGAWATVYTTSGAPASPETTESWKYSWEIGSLGSLMIYASSTDAGSVTVSSNSLVVNENGCEITASGPDFVSDYSIKIFKVKIYGTGLDNSKLAVKVKHSNSNVAFTASSTVGEFFLTTPEEWDGYYDELSIEVNDACTITGVEIHSTQISTSDVYSWENNPTDGGNAINGAKQNDGSLVVNMREHTQYTYPFTYKISNTPVSSISYSSSNTTVATVADGGVVTLLKDGSTVIFAIVPLDNGNSITFGYNLTVTNTVSYGLTVAGIKVTSENASAITGNSIQGTVTFTPADNTTTPATPATLTLNEAGVSGSVVWSNSEDLTVNLVGPTYFSGESPSGTNPVFKGNGGALLFTTSDTNPGSLGVATSSMNCFANGWGDGSTPIWDEDNQNDCANYVWWADQGCAYMTIAPNKKYGIKVNGSQFCDAWWKQNEKEIEYPEMSMRDDNQLMISGTHDYAITSNMSALTVVVLGKVTMSSIRFAATDQVTTGTLTISSMEGGDYPMNSLTLTNAKDQLSTISGFTSVNIEEPLVLKTPSEIPEWDSYNGGVFMADYYGLTINGVDVTNENAANVFDDYVEEGGTPKVVFDAENSILTLNNCFKQYDYDESIPFIVNGYGDLTINLMGDNGIRGYSAFLAKKVEGSDNYAVTFTTSESNPGNLSVFASNVATGHTISYANGLALSTSYDSDYGGDYYVIAPTTYDLTVGSVTVTSVNASDVLGDGKVSFTPAQAAQGDNPATPATLTLNGATINGRIYSGLQNGLKVHLLGNNVIDGGYVDANNNGEYAFVREAAGNDLPLTFTTDAKNPGQLLMKNTYRNENNYAQYYSGFIDNYENGLAAGYSSDEKILITVKPVITPDEGLYWPDQEYAITGNGSGTIKYADGMNHFSETTYSGPFTLSTVGKYLLSATQPQTYDGSTFEVSTSGVYIVHNKPAFSIEEGSYVGTQNVTLTNLPTNLSTTTTSYPQVWYYLGENKNDSVQYTSAEQTIAVSESTKVCVYILDQDSGKVMKSKAVEAEYTILKSLGLRFYTSDDSYIQTGNSEGPIEYRSEYTAPTLKVDTGDGYTTDLSGFNITYSSSDPTTATIDETGKITIVGGGFTIIKAESEATDGFAADATWYELSVRPADPDVSISEGAYFTGQKLTLTRVGLNGSMYYSYGSKEASERTAYTGEISLPAGVYDFYPYTRCGTDEKNIWSYGNAHRMLYVYDQPTISKDAGTYEGDIEVEITNLPGGDSYVPTVYYYFDDDEENAKVYNAGDKIAVRESTKLNVYLYVEGDSGKTHKTEVIERQYVIKDIPLAVTDDDFHNHWATYYNNNGNVALPEDKTIGAYIASGVGENSVTVTQIKSIPKGVPVFLNNETTTTTDNTDVTGNMLRHADEDIAVSAINGMVYGLYNGMMKRVHGTISAGKNYLLIPVATQPAGAPQLTIVIDGEESVTSVNNVKNKNAEVAGQYYDLTGRKLQQEPSKNGIYLKNGRKVIVNHNRKY